MIVKNEEANLPACLESVKGLFDEIIIVDTGSTDRTKEIALQYGAIVSDFEWIDDFAAARNKSLELAKGQWIFWLDADHRVDQDNYRRLKFLFEALKDEKIAFMMNERLWFPTSTSPSYNPSTRLFRNHALLRWQYRLHEQISPSLKSLGYQFKNCNIIIDHIGYEDPEVQQRKIERDYRLLEIEKAEIAQNKELLPHVYYHLSRYFREIHQPIDALPLLQYVLNNTPYTIYHNDFLIQLMRVYEELGQWENALNTCQQLKRLVPTSGQLFFEESIIYEKLGCINKAIEQLLVLCTPNTSLQIDDPSLLEKAHYNLAVYFRRENNLKEAEKHLMLAIENNSKFGIAWSELSGLYISQMRWIEALNACQKAKTLMPNDISAYYWESWLHLQLGNYSQAQALLLQLTENNQSLKNSSPEINLAKIYYNLGLSYYKQGDLIQAESSWNKSLKDSPQYDLSWIGLTNLWVKQAQWEKLSQAIAYLETTVHYEEMAIVIKAKLSTAQGKIPEAFSLLKNFITTHPKMTWPKIILGEIAINASQELQYAKKMLLEVLATDPNNALAKQLLNKIPHPR